MHDVAPSIQLGPSSFEAFFRGLPAITWCWTIQFNVLPVYNSLSKVNGRDARTMTMSHVSYWSNISLFCYYIIFGFAALIIWGNRINPDFMTNLDYNNTNYVFYYGMELSTTTQFIMCIVTFASIPMFAFEARTNSHYIAMDAYYKYIKNGKWKTCCCDLFKNGLSNTSLHHNRTTSITDYTKLESEASEANIDHEETPLMGSEHSSVESSDSTSNSNIEERTREYEDNDYSETWKTIMIESGTIIVTASIVALYLTNLNWCLSLVGATYGCYIAYFVPSIVYWKCIGNVTNNKLRTKHRILKYLAIVSILYGIIVCVLGVTMAFI